MQKKILIILILISSSLSYGQIEIPFYEQIAFEFYKDSLINKSSIKKRFKIAKYTMNIHPSPGIFQVNECLDGQILTEGKELEIFSIYALEQNDFDSPTHNMIYEREDQKLFKIKKSSDYGFPRILISRPYHKKDNYKEYYLIILEQENRKFSTNYYLKINDKGQIIEWCKQKNELITIR